MAIHKSKATPLDRLIGKNLRALRLSTGLSRPDIANHLGVSFQQVEKYERGRDRLSAARLYILACFFGVPLEAFFTRTGEDEDNSPNKKGRTGRKT